MKYQSVIKYQLRWLNQPSRLVQDLVDGSMEFEPFNDLIMPGGRNWMRNLAASDLEPS